MLNLEEEVSDEQVGPVGRVVGDGEAGVLAGVIFVMVVLVDMVMVDIFIILIIIMVFKIIMTLMTEGTCEKLLSSFLLWNLISSRSCSRGAELRAPAILA